MEYRLFLLRNGHICASESFEAESDAAAIARAETMRGGQGAELWNRARTVRAFAASSAINARPSPPSDGRGPAASR